VSHGQTTIIARNGENHYKYIASDNYTVYPHRIPILRTCATVGASDR